MFDKDNWQEIFATIRKNRLRTFLTSLGVGWGIFMLVIMLGAGNGLQNGIMQDFNGTATNSFYMWTQKTSKAYKGMKPGRSFYFNNADVAALSQLKELEVVSPQNQLGGHAQGSNVIRGIKTGNFQVGGVYPNISSIQYMNVTKGRFLNDNDIKEKRKVCVIGTRVKEVLFNKGEEALGNYIRINGVYFKIIGCTTPTGNGDRAREESERIMIPFTTFQSAFNYGDIVGWFAIAAHKNIPAEAAEKIAIAFVKERHKVAPEDEQAIGHWNMGVQYKKMTGLFIGISLLAWAVGAGTLIAGVIGISNIMLIVVKERTREIGVKRALGATPSIIIGQIMLESIFLTILSGYVGLLSGLLLLEGLNSAMGEGGQMFRNPTVDLPSVLGALGVLIVSGALAGLIPAFRAVSVNPVEALRAE
jgi:putative ABC transport system permease protein